MYIAAYHLHEINAATAENDSKSFFTTFKMPIIKSQAWNNDLREILVGSMIFLTQLDQPIVCTHLTNNEFTKFTGKCSETSRFPLATTHSLQITQNHHDE